MPTHHITYHAFPSPTDLPAADQTIWSLNDKAVAQHLPWRTELRRLEGDGFPGSFPVAVGEHGARAVMEPSHLLGQIRLHETHKFGEMIRISGDQ